MTALLGVEAHDGRLAARCALVAGLYGERYPVAEFLFGLTGWEALGAVSELLGLALAAVAKVEEFEPGWLESMLVSLASVVVNGVTAFVMVRVAGFGHAGLALSSSVVSTFSSLALLLLLRVKIGGVDGQAILGSLLKIIVAAGVMGTVCWGVLRLVPSSRIGGVALGVPAGIASFYIVAAVLRVPELEGAKESVLKRLRGRS